MNNYRILQLQFYHRRKSRGNKAPSSTSLSGELGQIILAFFWANQTGFTNEELFVNMLGKTWKNFFA